MVLNNAYRGVTYPSFELTNLPCSGSSHVITTSTVNDVGVSIGGQSTHMDDFVKPVIAANPNYSHGDESVEGSNDSTWVNADATLNLLDPNVVKVAEIFYVPLKTLADIAELGKGIKLGKYEAVWTGMISDMCQATVDTIDAYWMHSDESPIVQFVSIHEKTSSCVGIAAVAILEPKSLTMGALLINDSGFTIETVSIEYEWKPPRCDLCMIFGHIQDHCPKKVSVPSKVVTPSIVTPTVEKPNDGFQTVAKKKKNGKSKSTNGGHPVKQTVRYEPKATTSVPKKGVTILSNTSKSSSMLKNQPSKVTAPSTKECNITMSNSYAALDDESDEDVENVYDESANLLHSTHIGGSSSTFTVAAG
uniref:Zinc knuckle CX2CX4HX4C n=1 Tax=Tanacetum cinerariifolium TaxID=118510 RepID=A0A6L2LZH9_TANCI|nr:zinc knuckle CX2CX4HX4C [Tanacetum cinerariifolium]